MATQLSKWEDNGGLYCWSRNCLDTVEFGSYTGNGSSSGPTVTTGFKPRYLLVKRTDATGAWVIQDTERGNNDLYANSSEAEGGATRYTYTDTGFTVTSTGSAVNASGGTYIYAAYADKPDGSAIDSLIDTPTNYDAASGNNGGNYATLNPLDSGTSNTTFSNGNLEASTSTSGWHTTRHTVGMSSGKWYWEVLCTSDTSGNGLMVGILDPAGSLASYVGSTSGGYSHSQDAKKYNNGSNSSYGTSFTDGDLISVAFDADAGTLVFYKNGVSQGTAFSSIPAGTYLPATSLGNTMSATINHGARPFAYTPPTGYLSLCTQNLADPTIADGSTAFDAKLWTGTGSSRSITGYNFSPDWVWIKPRNAAYNNALFDTVRGSGKRLKSNDTVAEDTDNNTLSGFSSDGFSLGTNNGVNQSSKTYVAWAWDAGSSTVSNTDGSVTSSVRANASAGFSIVSYTGTGSGISVGHGLNAKPALYIQKDREATESWRVYTTVIDGSLDYLLLHDTSAKINSSYTAPTSSVLNIGGPNNDDHIVYCFAPVAGYSSFGTYTGNGSSDGPFVHTGFRPALIFYKRTDSTGYWRIMDSTRDPHNVAYHVLFPNTSDSESTTTGSNQYDVDILSNGFKIRTTLASSNASGGTFVYACFASHPFKTARAR